jgi:hypothetical protein
MAWSIQADHVPAYGFRMLTVGVPGLPKAPGSWSGFFVVPEWMMLELY